MVKLFIDKDSIIINGISMGQYLTNAKYGFYDTWASDTGYSLANTFSGTFKGTFPKLMLSFAPLTPQQITYLTTHIFRTVTQTITYDDPDGTRKTIATHKGDLELDFNGINQSSGFRYDFVGNEAL